MPKGRCPMADLKFEIAQGLVGSLLTAGHPYQQSAINATALLLIKLCKGAIVNGVPWSPEQQATALVEEAALWEGGWPDKGGPKQLLDLYKVRFKSAGKSTFVEPTPAEKANYHAYEATICAECHDFGTRTVNGLVEYCPCRQGEIFAATCGGQSWLDRVNSRRLKHGKTAQPAIDVTKLLAQAQANYADERRRKKEQLENVGCD